MNINYTDYTDRMNNIMAKLIKAQKADEELNKADGADEKDLVKAAELKFNEAIKDLLSEDLEVFDKVSSGIYPVINSESGDMVYLGNGTFPVKELTRFLEDLEFIDILGLCMTEYPTLKKKKEQVRFSLHFSQAMPIEKNKHLRVPMNINRGFKINKTKGGFVFSKEIGEILNSLSILVRKEFGVAYPPIRIMAGSIEGGDEDFVFLDIMNVAENVNGVIKPRKDMTRYISNILARFIIGCKLRMTFLLY